MSAAVSTTERPEPESSALLRTLVLCDLVNSTALVENLGDREAAELIRKHDRLARTIADRHGGREIDKTDGFLMMFERPIQAVGFALDYQRGLRQLNAAEGLTLSARVGIHVGDVVVWENNREDIARGAKQVEVEGLVKPIASRLMSLALPGQILLSNIAYDLAHRAQGELGIKLDKVRWRTHGRYRFRGIPDPVAVFEVGEDGLAPLKPPPWSSKAHREVPFWRRPATVVIESLVVAILIAIPIYMFAKPEPAIAFANRDWVVVGSLNNLTGETVFDDALESALRIGLEQSRYVNVLPDLKVRDTLKRMERDPDKTKVDRDTGSEVAIRDGARALILPTIAEIGGRVRITAEVIDPQTQTTVYSESADGIGAESVLPSLDTINGRLRVRLGEALATVSQESLPLQKVATKNIDALRMYSLAIKERSMGEVSSSSSMLETTLDLDPGFARARIELASNWLQQGRRAEAREQLTQALLQAATMSTRDTLMTHALLAEFSSPQNALEKWKIVAESYPDLFRAQGALGYFSWHHANDYPAAIKAIERNIVEQNPNAGVGHYLLGTLLLGEERYAEALKHFSIAEERRTRYQNQYYASAFAAQRQYDRIPQILQRGREDRATSERLSSAISRASLALDQGNWAKVRGELRAVNKVPDELGDAARSTLEATTLGIDVLLDGVAKPKALLDVLKRKPQSAKSTSAQALDDASREARLFLLWIAARYGDPATVRMLHTEAMQQISWQDDPAKRKMLDLIDMELERRAGNFSTAISKGKALVDGTEPYITHLAMMDALAAVGDINGAREQALWMSRHRGRAYTEVSFGEILTPFNVAQSNLALLYAAEFSLVIGNKTESLSSLDEFDKAWPLTADMPSWIRERVMKVRKADAKKEASAPYP